MIHSTINSEVIISFLKYSSKSLEVIILHQVYFQNIMTPDFEILRQWFFSFMLRYISCFRKRIE